jgi:hypothetical protein
MCTAGRVFVYPEWKQRISALSNFHSRASPIN